jgi:membrane protease YdiL (CAAX protease family)
MSSWDQASWAFLAIIIGIIYQTPLIRILRTKSQNLIKNPLTQELSFYWTLRVFIPIIILISHGSLQRMGIRLPNPSIDIIVVWFLLFLTEYALDLSEFYLRNKVLKDTETAKKILSWTEDINIKHGIIGGFIQNVPEETFHRGYLLAEIYPFNPYLGYAFSSIAFGLTHKHWDKYKILKATITGVIFAYLFIYTNSIIPPIIAHIASNLLIIPPARHWSKQLLNNSISSSR